MRRLERELQRLITAVNDTDQEQTDQLDTMQLRLTHELSTISANETRQTEKIIAIEVAVDSNSKTNAKLEIAIKKHETAIDGAEAKMAQMKASFGQGINAIDQHAQATRDNVRQLETNVDKFKTYRQSVNESILAMNERMKVKGLTDFRMREKLAQRIKDGKVIISSKDCCNQTGWVGAAEQRTGIFPLRHSHNRNQRFVGG